MPHVHYILHDQSSLPKVASLLKELFTEHGMPSEQNWSDNEPQYTRNLCETGTWVHDIRLPSSPVKQAKLVIPLKSDMPSIKWKSMVSWNSVLQFRLFQILGGGISDQCI